MQHLKDVEQNSTQISPFLKLKKPTSSIKSKKSLELISKSVEDEEEEEQEMHNSQSYLDLIIDLLKLNTNPNFCHYTSLSNVFYCKDCQMIMIPNIANQVWCKVPKFIVSQNGTINCVHSKCSVWNLTNYMSNLVFEFKHPKEVYWHIWFECHFLKCTACNQPYPVKNSNMCRYHPKSPVYFTIEENNHTLEHPIGCYTCCGTRAFKFETIKNHTGCRFRSHVPLLKDDPDKQVYDTVKKYSNFIVTKVPEIEFDKEIIKLIPSNSSIECSKYSLWWNKLILGEYPPLNTPITSYIWNYFNSPKKKKTLKDPNKLVKKKLDVVNISKKNIIAKMNESSEKIDFKYVCRNSMVPTGIHQFETTINTSDKNLWSHVNHSHKNQETQRLREIKLFQQMALRLTANINKVNSLADAYDLPICHLNPEGGYYNGLQSKILKVNEPKKNSSSSSSFNKLKKSIFVIANAINTFFYFMNFF